MTTRPSFVLSRPHGTVVGHGRAEEFASAAAAQQALRTGRVDSVVGAISFTADHPDALLAPDVLECSESVWSDPDPSPLPVCAVTASDTEEHLARVRSALTALRDGEDSLEKVVLARALTLTADAPLDPFALLTALVSSAPVPNGFLADLSAAGGEFRGRHLVGSSPEVLVRRVGTAVRCHPLAGSAPRFADPERDAASAATLLASRKDFREHAFVVDALRSALEPLCSELQIAAEPTLTSTRHMWHLGTPVTGVLADASTTALDLALALHPTPAVCGTPTARAHEVIADLEPERGFYAGAVGWCDGDGDGEWMVGIRCVEIMADRLSLRAWAGGGIVAESDPEAELDETTAKFRTVLSALLPAGVTDVLATRP